MSRKRIALLGSTGSIGTQTLEVVREHTDHLQVVAMAAGSNTEALEAQSRQFGVDRLVVFNGPGTKNVAAGMTAILDLVTAPDVDVVVVSVAGVIGLLPTLQAIDAGKDIALASKEVLVAAGKLIMPRVKSAGVKLTPIDSEHSAIYQCLQGYQTSQIERLILTASGGPFRGKKRNELESVTVEQALNHPTWRMGGKITVDSATLMNKGLETLEAMWLFDLPVDRIDTVLHPQSILHSLVQFRDGSMLGQLGLPSMKLPIAYALLHPDRVPNRWPVWNPATGPSLTFEEPDVDTFPCLALARDAGQKGGLAPCALNAANEEAANAFLRGEVSFLDISDIVAETVDRIISPTEDLSIESILQTDAHAREIARKLRKS